MFLKVCGITRLTDALQAVQQGANALGFVFWTHSPRFVTPERAGEIIRELPSNVAAVGVFVNEPIDGIRDAIAKSGITTIQLHGDEPPAYADALAFPVLRAVDVDEARDACPAWPANTLFLVDAIDPVRRGGTGEQVDWIRAAAVAREWRVVLAGGLTPDNVADAIAAVRPFGVDVSTGVEASPGVKDFDKVARFVANARRALEEQ
jgi:phosphoribosylanthranilate isomerase